MADPESRTVEVNLSADSVKLKAGIEAAINGVLAHELSVGDSAYIPDAYKIVTPFDIDTQFAYSLLMGAKLDDARLLSIGRYGMLHWYSTMLKATDIDETIKQELYLQGVDIVVANNSTTLTGKEIKVANVKTDTRFVGKAVTIPDTIVTPSDALLGDIEIVRGIKGHKLVAFMKDVIPMVAMNLVKTNHHYQELGSSSFLALERKFFGSAIFTQEQRGILYHDCVHPFVALNKLLIYTSIHQVVKDGSYKNHPIWSKLDPVVVKRVPVVPAGAAWLSAGLTIMDELMSVPKISDKIPHDYATQVEKARQVLAEVKDKHTIHGSNLAPFEGMAAFAAGLLREFAPSHTAIKAPSLQKMMSQHVGATTAGQTLGVEIIRS